MTLAKQCAKTDHEVVSFIKRSTARDFKVDLKILKKVQQAAEELKVRAEERAETRKMNKRKKVVFDFQMTCTPFFSSTFF